MTLIDKAALLNRIATEVHYDSEHSLEMYAKLLSEINDAPTVDAVPLEDYKSMEQTVNKLTKAIEDAVPVVRCKDCKWGTPHPEGDEYTKCFKLCTTFFSGHYCAWGERREDVRSNDR